MADPGGRLRGHHRQPDSYYGEAMSLGERAPVALLDFAASGRPAVGEALTNPAATEIGSLKRVKLSANWMAAAGHPGEDAGLYEAVKAVGEELCPALGITIPVGKDSMSMKTRWQEGNEQREMTSPLSLVITAFARVEDVRHTVTPQLRTDKGDSALLLIDTATAITRWVPPRWRRFTANWATNRPTCATLRSWRASSTPCSSWWPSKRCWLTTTAPTAACW